MLNLMDLKIRKNKHSYTISDIYKSYTKEYGADVPYFLPKSGADVPSQSGADVPWITLMSPYSANKLGTFRTRQNLPFTHFLAKPIKAAS